MTVWTPPQPHIRPNLPPHLIPVKRIDNPCRIILPGERGYQETLDATGRIWNGMPGGRIVNTGGGGGVPAAPSGVYVEVRADSGVYNDAGSTLATNGQTVQQWNDYSGNARHASQATSGNRPTYQTNRLNGKPALLFSYSGSGTTYWMRTANFAAAIAPVSMYIVLKIDAVFGGKNAGIAGGISGARNFFYYRALDQKLSFFAGTEQPSATGPDTGVWHYYSVIFNGASSAMYRDGVSIHTANPGSQSLGALTFGSADDAPGLDGLNGEIAHIMIYNAAHNDTTRGEAEAYLAATWGL